MMNRRLTIALLAALSCGASPFVLPQRVVAADTTDNSGGELEEITVSARKREEREIDVPISMQAFSGADLEKNQINNITDLYATVPSLYFSANELSPGRDLENLVIRGVGAESAGPPAVATIIDGVYVPSLAFDSDFLDAQSVEVLKGPQGTIFGRNTEAGALNITMRKPDATTRGSFAATFDSFNTEKIQGNLSGPLSDVFFASVALADMHTDGYLTDPTLGNQSADQHSKWDGRAALRYKPNDQLDVNFSVDSSETKGFTGAPGVPLGQENYKVYDDFLDDAHFSSLGSALSVTYDFGDLTFTSLTGARKLKSIMPYDFSGGPVTGVDYPGELMDLHEYQSVLSQEFRLNGKSFDNTLNWLTGVYVFQDKDTSLRRLLLPYLPAFGTSYNSYKQDQYLTTHGFAVFADGTYDITQKLSLDVGLRYGDERTTSNFFQYAVIPGIVTLDSGVGAGISTNYTTPSASLLYHVTSDNTVYTRYARGIRAAGFPIAPTPPSDIAYKPEKTDNYEVGTKGRILDNLFGYDLSVYYIKITDQQVNSVVYLNGNLNLPVAAIDNAGKSDSKGVEADFDIHPIDALAVTANFGYTKATYQQYIDADGVNRAGEAIPFVPRFTAATAADYTVNTFGKPLTLRGEFQHVSPILSGSGVDFDIQFHIPSYNLTNLSASLALTDKVKIDLFVKNVFDKYIETKAFNSFFFIVPRPFATVLPPRYEGGRITYSF